MNLLTGVKVPLNPGDGCKVPQYMNLLRWTSLAQSVFGKRDEAWEYDGADQLRHLKARCKEIVEVYDLVRFKNLSKIMWNKHYFVFRKTQEILKKSFQNLTAIWRWILQVLKENPITNRKHFCGKQKMNLQDIFMLWVSDWEVIMGCVWLPCFPHMANPFRMYCLPLSAYMAYPVCM